MKPTLIAVVVLLSLALSAGAGDHTIELEKPGFKPWEKTLTVTKGENATVSASLEQQASPPQESSVLCIPFMSNAVIAPI
jgi:hypothetical protein